MIKTLFKRTAWAALAGALLLGLPRIAEAAAFAKYDGIDGECDDASHEGWTDVLALTWAAQRPGSSMSSTARIYGPLAVKDLVLTMEYEKSSPKLQEKCLKGAVIPKLEIELTATFGPTRKTYLRYELTNVMITSYQTNASGNDEAGPPTVSVGCNFEEVKVTYTEYDSEGNSKGNVETEWKIVAAP